VTDEQFMTDLMTTLRAQADAGPMPPVRLRYFADSIELQLNDDRRKSVRKWGEQYEQYHSCDYNALPPMTYEDAVRAEKMLHYPAPYAASRNNVASWPPGLSQQTIICHQCGKPYVSIPRLGISHVCTGQEKADFWRCVHHPSAIDNWWAKRDCEFGCHKNELRWYDNGCSPATS
jgi:hypothetical protein